MLWLMIAACSNSQHCTIDLAVDTADQTLRDGNVCVSPAQQIPGWSWSAVRTVILDLAAQRQQRRWLSSAAFHYTTST